MRIRSMLRSLLVLPLLLAAPASAAPEVGERAPEFRFVGEGGRVVRFDDYFQGHGVVESHGDSGSTGVSGEGAGRGGGRRGVVIAWFPKAFTPG